MNCERERVKARALYRADPGKKISAVRALYKTQPSKKSAANQADYRANSEKRKAAVRARYVANPEIKKEAVRAVYRAQPENKKAAARAAYRSQPDKKKAAARDSYRSQPDRKKAATKSTYRANPEKMKTLFKRYHVAHPSSRLRYFRNYHCTKRMARYRLAQPTPLAVEGYVKSVKANLLANGEVKSKLKEVLKSRCGGLASPHLTRKDLEMTVGRLAAQRLVTKALQVRKRNAGLLLESLKHVKSIQLNSCKDFGKGCHTRHTEPYFYEAAYRLL